MNISYDLERSWISIRYKNKDPYENQCFYDYMPRSNTYRQICLSSLNAWSTSSARVESNKGKLKFEGKMFYKGRNLKIKKTFIKNGNGELEIQSHIFGPYKEMDKSWLAICKPSSDKFENNRYDESLDLDSETTF